MSQLKKGAVLNYVTIFLTNIVGLLLTPFIIRNLGDTEYGLYTLIGAFVGYISVLDFGLNNTIVRFVAKYKAEKDHEGEENFLGTTMLIYLAISLIILIIGTVCYLNIEGIFSESLTLDQMRKAKIMFVILIFNLAITLPGGAFTGICYGYEVFVFPKTVNIVRYLVRSLTIVAVLLFGGKAISMVIVDTAMNLTVIAVQAFYVIRKLKVKFRFHRIETPLIKEIFSYSVWIFIFALVGQFQWKSGQLVLGIMTNTTVVAIFAVGVMLGTYYGAFSTAISGVFLPRATQMTVANASPRELTNMLIKIGRLSFIVLMYILSAFILYGKQFVVLWVGTSYTEAYYIALFIMLAYTIPLVQAFANSILEAKNKMSFKAVVYLVFMIIGTGVGALLTKNHGATGMILGSIIGWGIGQNIMNFYYHRVIKLDILRFFKALFNKTLLFFLIMFLIGTLINYIPGEGWFNFITKAVIYSLIYIPLVYHIGMVKSEKELFKKAIPFLK
ncbi:oligosaccharide flippase family protein [Galbibacter sp. EGI 63066]|uniref:lipopolysaccharide biosynthesis protein n=1 Tax=Galbibacter sp. EGI 63066 TaxID=2993559 RepID=UPI00224895B4|nr:oligosaccharide flippase family protein [Galbibacter sp. EGI 63066]MCX2679164.1 oligosaccharide flippase family protein [Galbibacter sp. EGI 63066]